MKNKIYLEKMIDLKEEFSIKVLTGVRGVGKSTLLARFSDYLRAAGVPAWQIIFLQFEQLQYNNIRDYQELYSFIYEKLQGLPHTYLLLDEVQKIPGWEKALNAFFVDAPVDIYLAGSHAGILSKDFVKFFSGHYTEISVQPVSFSDYLKILPDVEEEDKDFLFPSYLKYGSLPVAMSLLDRTELLPLMLSGIYHTALMRDVVEKYAVRDPALIDSMARYLASSIGTPVTAKRVHDYLSSIGRKTTGFTMDNYLQMLAESYLFHRVRRYDIKAKAELNGSERFYISDIGLSNMLQGFQDLKDGPMLENVVYLELLRRGYSVYIGKLGTMEVSFVAMGPERRVYYQVVPSIQEDAVRKRVLRPLKSIPDQYEKVVLSMDRSGIRDFNGIRNVNIVDFLMGQDEKSHH